MKRGWLLAVLTLGLGLAARPGLVGADGAWLDAPLVPWNVAGMAIPAAPPPVGIPPDDPQCAREHRAPQTAEDAAVVAAGWTLFGAYLADAGIALVRGLVGHDGMCRPDGYQGFVFVDGVFAGTISPVLMHARTDGAEIRTFIQTADGLLTQFARYADTDPLCCPSRMTTVEYRIERSYVGPVLVPVSSFTVPRAP